MTTSVEYTKTLRALRLLRDRVVASEKQIQDLSNELNKNFTVLAHQLFMLNAKIENLSSLSSLSSLPTASTSTKESKESKENSQQLIKSYLPVHVQEMFTNLINNEGLKYNANKYQNYDQVLETYLNGSYEPVNIDAPIHNEVDNNEVDNNEVDYSEEKQEVENDTDKGNKDDCQDIHEVSEEVADENKEVKHYELEYEEITDFVEIEKEWNEFVPVFPDVPTFLESSHELIVDPITNSGTETNVANVAKENTQFVEEKNYEETLTQVEIDIFEDYNYQTNTSALPIINSEPVVTLPYEPEINIEKEPIVEVRVDVYEELLKEIEKIEQKEKEKDEIADNVVSLIQPLTPIIIPTIPLVADTIVPVQTNFEKVNIDKLTINKLPMYHGENGTEDKEEEENIFPEPPVSKIHTEESHVHDFETAESRHEKRMKKFFKLFTEKHLQQEDNSYTTLKDIIERTNLVRPTKISNITEKDVLKYLCPGCWKTAGVQKVLKGWYLISNKKKIL